MILANLTKAIREQNYYAVVLEFLIVIAGVVIGFQIQGWAESRRLKAEELEFVDQLWDEIQSLQQRREHFPESLARTRSDHIVLQEVLHDSPEIESLSDRQCFLVAASHRSTGLLLDRMRPVDTLMASGDWSFLRDKDLVEAISVFMERREIFRDASELISNYRIPLTEKYPDLFQRRLSVPDDGGEVGSYRPSWIDVTCDLGAMRNNNAFLNDFTTNVEALLATQDFVTSAFDEILLDLETQVEAYRSKSS